ncbi:hypothetical protein NUSPORA_02494 [Nucleospora cyclopteri]
MSSILKEINEKLTKFNKEEKEALIKFYIKYSFDRIKEDASFNNKKLILLLNLAQYTADEESKLKLLCWGLKQQILATRALILDLIDFDFTKEKTAFYKPDKWVNLILKGIKETFNYENILKVEKRKLEEVLSIEDDESISSNATKESDKFEKIILHSINDLNIKMIKIDSVYNKEDLQLSLELYNEMLCNEFLDIFLGADKFNSAGNQLLLNLIAYIDGMSFLQYDFEHFYNKVVSNFQEDKVLPKSKILQIYNEYKKDKCKIRQETSRNTPE